MRFQEIITYLKKGDSGLIEYHLGLDPDLDSGASLEKGKANQISFLEEGNTLQTVLNSCNAGAILLPNLDSPRIIAEKKGVAWATFRDPRLAFAETLDLLYPSNNLNTGIHITAVIGEKVDIGKNVYIGPNVSIGSNCKIGDNAIIHSGVVIYDHVVIGNDCQLHSNCVVHSNSRIGNICVLNSNCVIGSEGFGFVPTKNGWRKMPQTGITILEDKVEIGSCSTIDRPSVGETLIKEGTKIDNLVQIGHGVSIGKNCAMASQVGIAGGAKIGNGVILAGQVGVGNRVKVSDGVIASSKTGIHADIPEKNSVISGFPAMPNRLWLKCSAYFKKLPEIAKVLKKAPRS